MYTWRQGKRDTSGREEHRKEEELIGEGHVREGGREVLRKERDHGGEEYL